MFEVKWETVCWIVFFTSFLSSSSVLGKVNFYLLPISTLFCFCLSSPLCFAFLSAFAQRPLLIYRARKNLFILIITLGCSSRLGSSSSHGWGWSSPSCCSRGRGTPLVDSQPLKHSKWCPSKSHSTDTREVEIFWYVFFFLTFSSFRCVQNMNFQGNCDFVK